MSNLKLEDNKAKKRLLSGKERTGQSDANATISASGLSALEPVA